ncbi:hypothetical protein TWF481_011510 [Arthrobotrys musiformis]|uniref:Uncharacterized protein n=1 Tax=Arthrobotrys musiformis TaxID=47236 RepID=A0AAV9W4J8_9PEZI
MRIDTPTTQKVTKGNIRSPGPFASPWMDVGELSTPRSRNNGPPPPPPPSRKPVPSRSSTVPVSINATPVNNQSKDVSQNEERLERRMTGLSVSHRASPMYQEHVCAEDFYKQPREVYKHVVIVAKERIIETQVLEGAGTGGVNESLERGGNSWRFESEVLWSDGGKSAYYETTGGRSGYHENAGAGGTVETTGEGAQASTLRMENQSTEQRRRGEGLQNLDPRNEFETTVGNKIPGAQERVESSRAIRGQESAATAALHNRSGGSVAGETPGINQIPSKGTVENIADIDAEARGEEIRKRLESNDGGWKLAFELFGIGKVPDTQSFLLDVLEEFIKRRPQYWENIEKQGFQLKDYLASDDDELFLQLSYTNSALEAIDKGNYKRAQELALKVVPIVNSRMAAKQSNWIVNIEVMEVIIFILYLSVKTSKPALLESADEPGSILKELELGDDFGELVADRTAVGMKWYFQLHFLLAMLLEPDQRSSFTARWLDWLDQIPKGEKRIQLSEIADDMEGIEVLRYATEAAATPSGSRLTWSRRSEVGRLSIVSPSYLCWFASIGHKEAILKNLETLYDLGNITRWDGKRFTQRDAPLKPPKPHQIGGASKTISHAWRGPFSGPPTQQLPVTVEVFQSKEKSKAVPGVLQRQGSIRHPSPWESGLPSSSTSPTSQPQPRRPSDRSIQDRSLPPWTVPTGTSQADHSLKVQRLANLREQPNRLADDCTTADLSAITDFKHAIRHSQNLDVHIGTLASLHLINFISGNPEYRPWTPLIEAICNQRWDAARTLIRLGASFNLGYPFHTALSRHFMPGSRARCEKLAGRKLIKIGRLSPDEYFSQESAQFIEYMMDAGADVNALGVANTDLASQVKTYPIHLAALDPVIDTWLVWKLLKRGADVWKTDANGELAIDYAARADNKKTIKMLQDAMTE